MGAAIRPVAGARVISLIGQSHLQIPGRTPLPDIPARLREALADRHLIERELGRGGMATVYLVRDLKHRRHVALEVLLPAVAAALGVERFEREIELAARLQHPYILGGMRGRLWQVS